MEIKDTYYEAIKNRRSRRKFETTPIDKSKLKDLNELISKINEESKMNIQLIEDGSKILNGFRASYGMISGKMSVVALIGNEHDKDLKEKAGYYGEYIVLEAVSLGLGTCWVGGTFNKKKCNSMIEINDNENLVCIIAIGNVKSEKSYKEKLLARSGNNKKAFDEILLDGAEDAPEWIENGINMAIMAPSAMNKQPVGYSYRKGVVNSFFIKNGLGYEEVDSGISMAHFEIGAYQCGVKGNWERKREKYIFNLKK